MTDHSCHEVFVAALPEHTLHYLTTSAVQSKHRTMLRISLRRIESSLCSPSVTISSKALSTTNSYRSITSQRSSDERCRPAHRQQTGFFYCGNNGIRRFSDNSDGEAKKKKKDLRESVEKLKGDQSSKNDESASADTNSTIDNEHLDKLASITSSFVTSLSETWNELIASGQAKDINKKIGSPSAGGNPNYANDDEAADKYEEYAGSKDIMLIDPEEHLSAWERMEKRLRDAPIIQGTFETEKCGYFRVLTSFKK